MTINRFCSSGLQTIATGRAARHPGEGEVYVAGGVESISCDAAGDEPAHAVRPGNSGRKARRYWSMLRPPRTSPSAIKSAATPWTAGAASQQKACAAQAAGLFDAGLPIDRDDGAWLTRCWGLTTKKVTVAGDEGTREGTTKAASAASKPRCRAASHRRQRASQFSDGAGACVVVSEDFASKTTSSPGPFPRLCRRRLQPDEMGIGPVFAIPKY